MSLRLGCKMSLIDEESLCNAITALYLEYRIQNLKSDYQVTLGHNSVAPIVRSEICHFRHRRLLIGDIPTTRHIHNALEHVKRGFLLNGLRPHHNL